MPSTNIQDDAWRQAEAHARVVPKPELENTGDGMTHGWSMTRFRIYHFVA
jgi:hypothetical protein